jgi:hypothetical protein
MANALFQSYVQNRLTNVSGFDLSAAGVNVKLVLVDHADDTPAPTTDDFFNDIASAARVAISGNLANKSVTARVFDADDITLTAVTGDQFESIVVYRDTGTESTSDLIAFFDTATGLPFTPSGGDITITWDNGANKVFKL